MGPSPALPPVTPLANAPSRPNALWADLDPPAALCPPGLRPSAQQVRAETGGLVCGSAKPGRPSGRLKEPPKAVLRYTPIHLAVIFSKSLTKKTVASPCRPPPSASLQPGATSLRAVAPGFRSALHNGSLCKLARTAATHTRRPLRGRPALSPFCNPCLRFIGGPARPSHPPPRAARGLPPEKRSSKEIVSPNPVQRRYTK